jgi:hypothetical protein
MLAFAVCVSACTAVAGLDDLAFTASSTGVGGEGAGAAGTTSSTVSSGGGSTTSSSTTGGMGGGGGATADYSAEVLADNPLAYWRFGEAAGPAALDASGSGRDGTYVGGVTLGEPGLLAGDSAARFDGMNDEMSAGEIFNFAGSVPFTIELWIKPDDIDSLGALVSKYGWDGSNYFGWLLTESSNVANGVRFRRTGSSLLEGTALVADEFNHVVVTFDGVTQLLFINGVEAGSRAGNALVDLGKDPFRVGRAANWASYAGVIDEVAIYGTALPPARIEAHRAAALAAP